MDNMFKIVVPVYNSVNWINKCIMSIVDQSYKNYKVIIIDDSSTDQTDRKIIETFQNPIIDKSKFRVFKRNMNMGALENIVFGIDAICNDPNDICVFIDGDDWLAHNDVLLKLNQEYQNNIFMTYGSYKNSSDGTRGLCSSLTCDVKDYRKSNIWCTSHLRTMRKFLWDNINKADLKDEFGKYYSMSWDLAIMIPALEMSGNSRVKYIEEILYVYNNENAINDYKKNLMLQLRLAQQIREKLSYRML